MTIEELVEALYEQVHKLASEANQTIASDVKNLWEQAKNLKVNVPPPVPATPTNEQK